MNNLTQTSQSAESMSSREIAEMYGKRHDDVLKKIRKLETAYVGAYGGLGIFTESFYLNSQNKEQPEIQLNKSQALFVASRFDAVLHAKVQKRWEDVETSQAQPALFQKPNEAVGVDLQIAEVAVRLLRLNDGSKIAMLSTIAKNNGRPTNFLPAYTEEKPTKSLTVLLKEHDAPFGAKKANIALISKGLVETKSRPSTKGSGVKEFKSLTLEGLRFGKNLISPNNQRETQPHFFVDTFGDLLGLIGATA